MTKDYLKSTTMKDFTAWDLNCKCVKKDHALAKKMKRKARRKNKIFLKNCLTN